MTQNEYIDIIDGRTRDTREMLVIRFHHINGEVDILAVVAHHQIDDWFRQHPRMKQYIRQGR